MSDLWQAVVYAHVLAMAFFVGGQLFLAIAVVPVQRRNSDPDRWRAVARRFGVGSAVALAILLTTGIAMASHFDRWESGTLQLKLGLVALVIVLTLAHTRYPRAHALHGMILVASLVIVWLGLELTR
jgi:uncharacterized membrane protein